MDLRRQIAIVRTWFPLLVACAVLAAGAALAVSMVLPKTYEARTRLIVGQSLSAANPNYDQLLVSQRLSTTYAVVTTTRPILETVIDQLNLAVTPDELLKRVRADAPLESTLLTIFAQDVDPSRAAAIANALAEQLIAASPAIQGREADYQASVEADLQATQKLIETSQAQVETLSGLTDRTSEQEASLATLEARLVTLRSTYASLLSFSSGDASNLLSVVEPAVAPLEPVSPRPLLNTLVAAVLGLMIAVGIAFVVEYLDDKVKGPANVQEVAGLSTLGTIARMKRARGGREMYQLASLLYPRSAVAEAYRTLRANIEFASVDAPIRALLVTSSIPGEGKTITAANLAIVFAQAGRPVLLVDADLRKPGVHLVFDLPNSYGLTTLLRSDEVSLDALVHETGQPNLRILTTGPLPPNPAELLGSQRMRAVLDRLQVGDALVIFDSPPLQAVTDAAILNSILDATLFVIDAERSRRETVRIGRKSLEMAGGKVLGAVLNRVPVPAHSRNHGYYGSYGSDLETEEQTRGTEETPTEPAS